MNKKELIQKIKKSALNEMPDVLDRINLNQIVIDEAPTKKSPFNLRKAFSYTFASFIVLLTGFSVYTFGVLPNVTDTTPLESPTEIIGFQTVTGATLIESIESTELSDALMEYDLIDLSLTTTETIDPEIEDQIDLINQYMKLSETVIDNQNEYIYEEVQSNRPLFQYAFEYRGNDLLGNLITYYGYYNSRESNGHTLYTGIIIHEDVEYRFSSSVRELNQNTYTAYRVELDDDHYVVVTNFSNKAVQKFEYKVYSNGVLNNSTELELTEKNNQLQAKLLFNKSEENEFSLEVTNNSDSTSNQYKILYKFTNKNKAGEIRVNLEEDQTTGEYKYQYVAEYVIAVKNRTIQSNGPANEDDFKPGNSRRDDVANTDGVITTTVLTTEDDQIPGNGPSSNATPNN